MAKKNPKPSDRMVKRSRFTELEIEQAVSMLDGWVGKLSWDALVEKCLLRWTRNTCTRQGLEKIAIIKDAFKRAKARQRQLPRTSRDQSLEMVKALERINFLVAQNDGLRAENNRLQEQFVRWAYNAHTKGLDDRYLNTPLPSIDRQPSRRR